MHRIMGNDELPSVTAPVRSAIGDGVYIAPTAYVGGDVTVGPNCTVMHHVTIRGDVSAIRIGRRVNVQDGTVVHTRVGEDLDIEDDVSIGHRAIVHCRRVGRGTLIGMGAILLDGCEVGHECVIAAGAVLPPETRVKPRTVMMGVPAKPKRDVTDQDLEYARLVLQSYLKLGRRHAAGLYPNAAAESY